LGQVIGRVKEKDPLQDLPEQAANDGAGPDVAPAHLGAGQEAIDDGEEGDTHDDDDELRKQVGQRLQLRREEEIDDGDDGAVSQRSQ